MYAEMMEPEEAVPKAGAKRVQQPAAASSEGGAGTRPAKRLKPLSGVVIDLARSDRWVLHPPRGLGSALVGGT